VVFSGISVKVDKKACLFLAIYKQYGLLLHRSFIVSSSPCALVVVVVVEVPDVRGRYDKTKMTIQPQPQYSSSIPIPKNLEPNFSRCFLSPIHPIRYPCAYAQLQDPIPCPPNDYYVVGKEAELHASPASFTPFSSIQPHGKPPSISLSLSNPDFSRSKCCCCCCCCSFPLIENSYYMSTSCDQIEATWVGWRMEGMVRLRQRKTLGMIGRGRWKRGI
jgi:hypothetical protein